MEIPKPIVDRLFEMLDDKAHHEARRKKPAEFGPETLARHQWWISTLAATEITDEATFDLPRQDLIAHAASIEAWDDRTHLRTITWQEVEVARANGSDMSDS